MALSGEYLDDHPFFWITVIACIVCATAITLLVLLLVKGWRTNSMRSYLLVYFLLLNMSIVWAF